MQVSTGINVTPYYDPLIAKVIVTGDSRSSAISKLKDVLLPETLVTDGTKLPGRASILGPPTNIPFLYQILCESVFVEGRATTEWVDQGGVTFVPMYAAACPFCSPLVCQSEAAGSVLLP